MSRTCVYIIRWKKSRLPVGTLTVISKLRGLISVCPHVVGIRQLAIQPSCNVRLYKLKLPHRDWEYPRCKTKSHCTLAYPRRPRWGLRFVQNTVCKRS